MSQAKGIGHTFRVRNYRIQNGIPLVNQETFSMTPAQRRRAQKKLGRFLAKRNVVNVRTVKGK